MKKRYDVIIIGAGSGLTISHTAAAKGKKVAIVESGPFGGTCLNRGCIPSKMLIHSADVADTIHNSKTFGINASIKNVNWKHIINRVSTIVDDHAKKIERSNKKNKHITVYKTRARFIGHKLLQVGKDTITAPKIVIAAGARPNIAPIPGLQDVSYITSDEALRLPKQPKHLVIIGGGYIGTELAHFFGSLGTKITILDRGDALMKAEDSDISKRFTEVYQRRYNIILNSSIKQVRKKGKQITIEYTIRNKKKTVTGDTLLVATGRKPNTDTLNVNATGVKTNKQGYVKVNKHMETTEPGIYALGDIAGVYMFKHSANHEAQYIANTLFTSRKNKPIDYTAMPHAAFTAPQVASVGYTEEELLEKKIKYIKGTYDFIDTGYGMAIKDEDGFVKVLASPNGKILGCHIIGSEASILIHEVIVAMNAGLGIKGIVDAVHIHPALSEVVQRAFNQLNT